MTNISNVIIGVDTHKATHVAVAIDNNGSRLAAFSAPATTEGYSALEDWASALGTITSFGIEGTGSYGAGLSRHLLAHGHKVIEVTRPNRQLRYQHGKSDSLDAEGAARSVLAGQATAQPKTQSGSVEMIRHLKIARDTAVKSRSQAMVTLKTLIINAPASLRDTLDQISGKITLIRYIAAFRPGAMTSTIASAKTALRALAQRWLTLHEEIQSHDKALEQLVASRASTLLKSHGIATMTAAEMLILVGDDPTRIRSEAALAKLCGACPIPASSGMTNRFRLNRGGNRQANAALYRVAIVRMRNHKPTLAYVSKRKKEGKSNREIIRCLKRYIVREIFSGLCRPDIPPAIG
tara:strand:- start:2043 stop:3095 length:1053 start_codon:yes stop_codon:yes gene_type:complete